VFTVAYCPGATLGFLGANFPFGSSRGGPHNLTWDDGHRPSGGLTSLVGLPLELPNLLRKAGWPDSPVCGVWGRAPTSPLGPFWHHQNFHQGRLPASSAFTAISRCSSEISCLRLTSSSSWAAMRSCSAATSSVWSGWPGHVVSSSTVTLQVNPCGVCCFLPSSSPLRKRRLTVAWLMCSRSAASMIVTSMPSRIPGWVARCLPAGYLVVGKMGRWLPW